MSKKKRQVSIVLSEKEQERLQQIKKHHGTNNLETLDICIKKELQEIQRKL